MRSSLNNSKFVAFYEGTHSWLTHYKFGETFLGGWNISKLYFHSFTYVGKCTPGKNCQFMNDVLIPISNVLLTCPNWQIDSA